MAAFEEPGEPPLVDAFVITRAWIVWYMSKTGVPPEEALTEWRYQHAMRLSRLDFYQRVVNRTPHNPAQSPLGDPVSGQAYADLFNRLKG